MLSPWTLSGAASAQADRPRMAHRKANRESRAKALSAGQCDESASCRAVGAVVTLAPPQHADMSCHQNKKTKRARASKHSPLGHTTPTGVLSHLLGWRFGAPGGCTTLTDHVEREITLWPNPLTRPKPRGLLSGATIRDTLIGVLRPFLKKHKRLLNQLGPRPPSNPEERKRLNKAQHAAHSHPPRTRGTISASLEGPSRAHWTISASLEGSGSTLERVTHLRLARG